MASTTTPKASTTKATPKAKAPATTGKAKATTPKVPAKVAPAAEVEAPAPAWFVPTGKRRGGVARGEFALYGRRSGGTIVGALYVPAASTQAHKATLAHFAPHEGPYIGLVAQGDTTLAQSFGSWGACYAWLRAAVSAGTIAYAVAGGAGKAGVAQVEAYIGKPVTVRPNSAPQASDDEAADEEVDA